MISTKLRVTMTARQTEALILKNKNQGENIAVMAAALKALKAENDTLKEAVNLMKQQARDGDPALHKDLQVADQHVVDLTAENNSLRSQLHTVTAKLQTFDGAS